MHSIIHHSGFSIPAVYLDQLNLHYFLLNKTFGKAEGLGLSQVDGYLKNSKELLEDAIWQLSNSTATAPFTMIKNVQPKNAGISTSPFTFKYITGDMMTELVRPVEYSKPEDDETDIESVGYTKRWRTEDILVFSDDSCLNIVKTAQDKKNGRPDYAKRREYDELRRALAIAIETALVKRGLRVNGVTYHYLTTGSSGLKQGKHYFVSDRVWEKCKPLICKLISLAIAANLPISKFLQYIALLLTDSNKMDLTEDFIKRIIIADVNELMKLNVECTMAVPDEVEDKTNTVCSIKKDSYENAWTDGAIVANSDFAENYAMHLVQTRGFGIKGQMQFVSFRRFAELSGLSDEQLQVPDIFGVKRDLREVSAILTKDSFKLLPLFKSGKYTSLHSFMEDFGFTDLYAVNVYTDDCFDIHSTVNYTKQMMAGIVITDEFVKEVASRDFKDVQKYVDMPDEEFIPFVASLYEGRIDKEIISPAVSNGAFAFTDEALHKVEEAYTAKMRNATQKWHINGHCLVAFPDIIALLYAFLGIEHDGLCGDKDAVYCPAYYNRKVMINRNPVIANDTAIQENLYREDNVWNEFLCKSVCYFGKKSTAPHMLGADYDGDKVNVTNNKILIERVEATNKMLAMPPVKYSDMKDAKYIAEESLATFSGTPEQIAACIVYAAEYSKYVGISAARISRLFCVLNTAVAAGDIKKANDIYLYDICPNAIQEQWAVDASKTLAFYPWAFTGSVMGILWYEATSNSKMITKEYKKVAFDKNKDNLNSTLTFATYASDALYPADDNGMEACWNDGTNVGAMHDYFFSRLPARLFFTYEFHYGKDFPFVDTDFFVTQRYRTARFNEYCNKYPIDKSVFCNNWKPQPGCYKVQISSKMVEIFGKYDISIGYKVDEEVVAKDLAKLYSDDSHNVSRFQKVDDMRAIYAEFSKLNKDAYLHLAREYQLNHITLSCFLETTARKVNGTTISDAAMFIQFGDRYLG